MFEFLIFVKGDVFMKKTKTIRKFRDDMNGNNSNFLGDIRKYCFI